MTGDNSTVTPTTTMAAWHESLPNNVMWIPYFVIGCLFLVTLAVSFRRHHLRQTKKKQYVLEYQEQNLSARRPRISGKLNFGQIVAPSDALTMSDMFSNPRSTELAHGETSKSERFYRTLSTEEMLFIPDSEFPVKVIRNRAQKRFKSAHDVNDSRSMYRQISEDEYFRRKGPRESLYLKSGNDRQAVTNRNKQRVSDIDMVARSFWIQSADYTHGEVDPGGPDSGVKYIKVFNLDLCTDCRMYVERVDVSTSNGSSLHNPDYSGLFPTAEKHCNHSQPDNKLNQTPSPIPDIAPEISIAEVHSSLPLPPQIDLNTTRADINNDPLYRGLNQLSPLQWERPNSAPNLLKQEHTRVDCFNLSKFKTKSQECIAPSWNEAGIMNSRL